MLKISEKIVKTNAFILLIICYLYFKVQLFFNQLKMILSVYYVF